MKTAKNFILFFCFLFGGFWQLVQAQDNFSVKHFKQQDGLPQNSVTHIYFSNAGFLWFTTEDGILRYDGVKNFLYTSKENEGIENDRFRGIFSDISGKLYSQTSDGKFFEIVNNHLEAVSGVNQNGISLQGLFPVQNVFNQFVSTYLKNDSFSNKLIFPYQILAVDSVHFFVMGKEQIFLFNRHIISQTISLPLGAEFSIFCFNSQVYLSNNKDEIYRVNYLTNKLEKVQLYVDKLPGNTLKGLKFFFTNPSAKTYFIDDANLYVLEATTDFKNLKAKRLMALPIKSSFVTTVAGNKNGDAFAIGTYNNGIFIYRKSYFKSMDVSEKTNNSYHAITPFGAGVLSTSQNFFTPAKVESFKLAKKPIGSNSIYQNNRFIWFYDKATLYKYDLKSKQSRQVYKTKNDISCINGRGDSLYVGTTREIHFFLKDTWQASYKLNQQNKSDITVINFSPSGDVYFANCIDLFKLKTREDDKLIFDALNVNACIRDIVSYKDHIFLCTYGKGIFVKHNNQFIKLPVGINAHLNKSHSIQIDANEHVWISTNNGIFETDIKLILNYLSDENKSILYNRYGTKFGMNCAEFNGGCYPASAKDLKGNIYFPSIQGIVTFHPDSLRKINQVNPIFIDQIYINRKPVYISDSIIYVGTDVESLKIKLLSSQWFLPADFEYQLIGYNKNPIRLVNVEDIISFTNLPAGEFLLKIRNVSGLNPNLYPQKQIRIIVAKRFYETAWFQLLIIIIFGSFIYAANQINNRILLKRNLALEQTIHNRTDELKKTNEVLSQANIELNQSVNVKNKLISIISHDIITPIKFMAIAAKNTIKKESKEELSQTLYDIQQTANRLHDNAQNVLNWIKYQNNLIEVKKTNIALYPLVEDLCDLLHDAAKANNNIIINEIEPDEIILSDGVILGILIHNLLSNAVKYVKNGQIIISFERINTQSVLTVSDTGMGMSLPQFNRVQAIISKTNNTLTDDSADGNGLGYIIISELASLLSAEISVLNEAGKGVSVHLIIP